MITITLAPPSITDIAKVTFMTLVFIGAVWYLAKITVGASREAREEIIKLRKETKEVWESSERNQ